MIKASAIVPCYNENGRIENVLKVLSSSSLIREIIVIDDGSTDGTEKSVKNFKKVRYFRNKKNKGKAYSMNEGVKKAKSSVIFFCDADLKDLTPSIVNSIIFPVLKKEYEMYIGIRNNLMQKTWKLVALNSGERALTKETWNKIPPFYKHRFRIEYGMNKFIKKNNGKIGYKVFPYFQTLKETKYGFLKGTFFRWWLNFDVFMAILRFNFYDRFK
jgi:glycosyltransferase involved in cell wall biosynthesis